MADINGFYSTFGSGNEKGANQTATKKKKTALEKFHATFEQPVYGVAPLAYDDEYFKNPANVFAMFEDAPKKSVASNIGMLNRVGKTEKSQIKAARKTLPAAQREVAKATGVAPITRLSRKDVEQETQRIATGAIPLAPLQAGLSRVAQRVLPQATGRAAQVIRTAAPGAAIGGIFGGGTAFEQGASPAEIAKQTAIGAGLGVAGEAAARGFGKLVQSLKARRQPIAPTAASTPALATQETPVPIATVRAQQPALPARLTRSGGTVSTIPAPLTSAEKEALRSRLASELGIRPEPSLPLPGPMPQVTIERISRSGNKTIEFPNRRYDPILAAARTVPRPQSTLQAIRLPDAPKPLRLPDNMPNLPPGISPMSFTVPEKMASVGEGQKVRSFQVSAAKAPITDDITKAGLVTDVYPGGPGAYDPIKLRAVDTEANKLVNTNIEKAFRFAMESKDPSALHTATGIRLIEKFQNQNNYDRAIDVAEALAEKLTKQGQAISAARIMGALRPDGVLVFAQRQINNINNSKLLNTEDLKLTPDMAKSLKELAQRVQDAADDAVRLEASQELQQALNSLKPAGIGRKIATAQTIAQLLNTKTIIRNVAGNELFYRLERLNKYPATLIDWTRSKITGGPRTVTFRTAGQGGYWKGFLQGTKAGWKGVNPEGITTQYDLGHGPAFNIKGNIAEKTMAYLERAMGATLKGFDYAAFNRAKNQTLGELATLRAINTTGRSDPATVRKFMQEAQDNLLDIADQYGKYVTFQDNNVISNSLVGVKRFLNKLTGSKDFGLGDIVLKYPKTPGALIARGLEYSPAGFLRSAYQLARVKGILRGTADPREVTLALSRAITGSLGLTGLGYYLADVGIITGSADKDKDIRALQQQVGEGPYRVNLTALYRWVGSGFNRAAAEPQEGDRLITYDWAQPIAMAISAGVNINQSIKEKATAEDAARGMAATLAGSLEGAVNTIAEQPVLQGLTRPLQGYSLGESLTGMAKSIPASFAPTLGNQVRTYTDNTSRLTYDPNPAKEALNRAQLKIPGVAGKLPPAYTTLGRKKETYQDGSNNLFNVFLNPSFISRYNLTPEARMVIETFKETGETKQVPRVVPKKFVVSGKSFVLTPQEYSEFQRIVGEQTTEGFSRIPSWLPTDKKIDRMVDVLTDAGQKGKKEILEARGVRVREKGNSLMLMP